MTNKPPVPPPARQSAPGRQPAPHVRAAVARPVQAKLRTPTAGHQSAAHVQAALAAIQTGRQAVQPKLPAGLGAGRQVAPHVERALGTLQPKLQPKPGVTPRPVVQRKFLNAFDDPLLFAQAVTLKDRFKASSYFLRLQRTYGYTADQVEEKLADLESSTDRQIRFQRDELGSLYSDENLRSIEAGILEIFRQEEREVAALIQGTWDGSTTITLPAGTEFNHGNPTGAEGGAGITGRQGGAIWLTSANDINAAMGYGEQSGVMLVYVARKDLKLARLNQNEQLFGDEMEKWTRLFPHLAGAYTPYVSTYEVVVFDKGDLQLKETRPFAVK